MREIKFRGKPLNLNDGFIEDHIKNGWVYGTFIAPNWICGDVEEYDIHAIYPEFYCEVDPETVGQYTGLKDKEGKEIYEGDIVECHARIDAASMVVIFEDGEFRMVLGEEYNNRTIGRYYSINSFVKNIIGNIYDNPELLEGKPNELD